MSLAEADNAAVRYQINRWPGFANAPAHLIYSVRFAGACAGLAQLVEQLFRKQQVCGSSPQVGSMRGAGTQADVAEQADALRSGRSGGNPVGVRISPSAPDSDPSNGDRVRARSQREDTHRRELGMAADPRGGLEESPSCTEQGCPVKAGEARQRVNSPYRRVPGRESNRNQTRGPRPGGLKRAILPAAISDSTVCRLLAEVGSREQSRRRRRDQPSRLREMAI